MLAYSEFQTTGATLLADLRSAILTCTDWSRLNSAARPDTYACTTTRGVQMVVDLADVAPAIQRMTLGIYTSYDGTTLGSKQNRYLWYKRTTTGALASNVLRCVVSVSKEHLFIGIEGPRPGDPAGQDFATVGSFRDYFFVCDLVPYFDSTVDPNPTVVYGGSLTDTVARDNAAANLGLKVYVTKSVKNVVWSSGMLQTLDTPRVGTAAQQPWHVQRVGPDGNYYLSPYVLFDDTDGIRGRLSSFFYAGPNRSNDLINRYGAPVGDVVTYNGTKYKLLQVNRSDGQNTANMFGALGEATNTTSFMDSPIVAVPFV